MRANTCRFPSADRAVAGESVIEPPRLSRCQPVPWAKSYEVWPRVPSLLRANTCRFPSGMTLGHTRAALAGPDTGGAMARAGLAAAEPATDRAALSKSARRYFRMIF